MIRIALALLACAAPLTAQAPVPEPPLTAELLFRPGTVAVSVYAVGAAFSDFQRATAQPLDDDVSFARRLSASTTAGVAVEVTTWITPALGLRVQGAWLPTRFDVKYEQMGAEYLRVRGVEAERDWQHLHYWSLDAAALVRAPFTLGRVAPYAILGGGIARYQARADGLLPPEAQEVFSREAPTSWALVAGLGATLPLQRGNLLLSFAITDHITPTPLDDEGGGAVYQDGSLAIRVADPDEAGADGVTLTSNVRLMVGLTLPLGRAW